ncbi:MAG: hypothetical protein H6823_14290 [Planctomycetaceae bacterium]|nr:hypothetical protein [Planctomycetales bacterium]MCB9939409.1 hypothetical protein [Planctomycetaceae bacterium]
MRTPLQAVLWELWRTSQLQLLLVFGFQFAIVLLMYSAVFDGRNSGEATVQVLCGIFIIFSTATSAFSQSWRNTFETNHIGFSFRLGFVRPISTTQLVAVPMVFVVMVAPLCYLLPALLFNWLIGITSYEHSVPLLGPSLLAACIAACLVAVAWTPTTIVGRAFGLVAVGGGLIASLAMYHLHEVRSEPLIIAIAKPGYFDFSWYEYAALIMLPAIAMCVTVIAVDRQRHGDRWQFARLGPRWRKLSIPVPANRSWHQPFSSPLAAQCWFEMRRFGVKLLILGLLAPLIPLAVVTFGSLAFAGREGAPWFWLIATGFCPLVYQMIGADGAIGLRYKQGVLHFSAFDATRAMPNDRLIAIKLLLISLCSLVGWLWMVLATGAYAIMSGEVQWWVQLGQAVSAAVGEVSVIWWIAGACCLVLLYISSTATLLGLGMLFPLYPGFFVFSLVAAISHLVLAIWDAKHGWELHYFWISEGWLLAVVMVLGSGLALRKALVSRSLGKQLFVGMFCLWAIYVSTAIAMFFRAPSGASIPPVVIAIGAAGLLVPLASAAFAPLALASHRHG